MSIRTAALFFTLLISACSIHGDQASEPQHQVSIMTLNVENLFDNIDDPGKDDKAYLPIAAKQTAAHKQACTEIRNRRWRAECLELDWSDAVVEQKLSVLAEVIKQVGEGIGPDVIAFQEVENERILERLRNEHLAGLGYQKSILIEGTDNRGIDVAFMSKLDLVGTPQLHPLRIRTHADRVKDTRGILEATFRLSDGTALTGYSVHFPAPYHPTEMRVAAYKHLQSLKAKLPEGALAFAAGDFNTTSTEDQQKGMLDTWVRPEWQVANDQCVDCRGTYYYAPDDNWSFLDMIIVAGSEASGWRIQPGSVHIANNIPAQVTESGTPARFRAGSDQGASDHWPLVLTLEKTPATP